jgi:hypothetical protein
MKKWAYLVAALYGWTFLALNPLLHALNVGGPNPKELDYDSALRETAGSFLILAPFVLAQFAFLRLPLALVCHQCLSPRLLWAPVIAAGFMMGLLVLGAGLSLCELHYRGIKDPTAGAGLDLCLKLSLASWVGWAIFFHQGLNNYTRENQIRWLQQYLWRASIIAGFIIVPADIFVRHWDHGLTRYLHFTGMTFYAAVNFFAGGPSLFFYLVERWEPRHPEA